jgi:hypothetical protein
VEIDFPRLKTWTTTSEPTRAYNCIAWAADDTTRFWWPPVGSFSTGTYWPPDVPRALTVAAFVKVFAIVGYEPCDNGAHEPGVEKVAIYADGGVVKHAARQLEDGRWTSKLGRGHDITHATVGDLETGSYGAVVQYLKRPILAIRPPKKAG